MQDESFFNWLARNGVISFLMYVHACFNFEWLILHFLLLMEKSCCDYLNFIKIWKLYAYLSIPLSFNFHKKWQFVFKFGYIVKVQSNILHIKNSPSIQYNFFTKMHQNIEIIFIICGDCLNDSYSVLCWDVYITMSIG